MSTGSDGGQRSVTLGQRARVEWLNEPSLKTPCVVESELLILDDRLKRRFSAATILRGFDRLRRALALRIADQEGAFAGYEEFELLLATVPPDRIRLVGRLVGRPALKHHRVSYVAYAALEAPSPSDDDLAFDLLIAHAVGTTVLPPARGCLDIAQSRRPTQF